MTLINLATEDELSENVACRLVQDFLPQFEIGLKLRKHGNGYLRTKFSNFCQLAQREFVFLITDLDRIACPPLLLQEWEGANGRPDRLIFRVAVTEIESWLLADHWAMGNLLGKGGNKLPLNPDELADPKGFLLKRAQRAPRSVKDDLTVRKGTVASQGLGYNQRLGMFVKDDWNPNAAADRSGSLARTIRRLREIG